MNQLSLTHLSLNAFILVPNAQLNPTLLISNDLKCDKILTSCQPLSSSENAFHVTRDLTLVFDAKTTEKNENLRS